MGNGVGMISLNEYRTINEQWRLILTFHLKQLLKNGFEHKEYLRLIRNTRANEASFFYIDDSWKNRYKRCSYQSEVMGP
jgi:hypothetical protein